MLILSINTGSSSIKYSVIDVGSLKLIKENIRLAPLHMPHMVYGIEMFRKLMPGKPVAAGFDNIMFES